MLLFLSGLPSFQVSHQLSAATHHHCFLKFKAPFLFAVTAVKKVVNAHENFMHQPVIYLPVTNGKSPGIGPGN
ncbi:MAG: hypothetical protein JWQ57_1789 [Mucilaginibacter sp.]|nr:hypothetical protein [Mucilaginibacter sp.]